MFLYCEGFFRIEWRTNTEANVASLLLVVDEYGQNDVTIYTYNKTQLLVLLMKDG